MGEFTIKNIPQNKLDKIYEGFEVLGYEALIYNPAFDKDLPEDPQTNPITIPNPETIAQFAQRMTIQWFKKLYLRKKIRDLQETIKDDL